jgi:hypothetical protein
MMRLMAFDIDTYIAYRNFKRNQPNQYKIHSKIAHPPWPASSLPLRLRTPIQSNNYNLDLGP